MGEFQDLTWDHVFPRGWYPSDTPEDIEKWKVPACLDCNRRYSEIERDLLIRFGLAFGPDEARAAGIADKAIRALNPAEATSDRDRRAREAARSKILSEAKRLAEPPDEGILPGLGPDPNLDYGDGYYTIQFPKDSIERLVEKIVRGVFFRHHGRFIESPHEVGVHIAHPQDIADVIAMIHQHAEYLERGPGIQIALAVPVDDDRSSIWHIRIWGRVDVYVTVRPPSSPPGFESAE